MRKVSILLCLFLLCGCFSLNENKMKEYNVKYESYLESIIDNSKQVTMNIPFEWKFNMYKTEDSYAYEVSIMNPEVAMYNIQFVAVDITQISEDTVAPCLGVFEEQTYNMIPNQANFEKGYYGAVGLNGTTDKEVFVLNCLVLYKDKNQNDNYIYFIILKIYTTYFFFHY